jgi:hypothetical protein
MIRPHEFPIFSSLKMGLLSTPKNPCKEENGDLKLLFYISAETKDPGIEGPALVHLAGVIWMITFTSSGQVSGVRCPQPNLTRCFRVAPELGFLSPVWVFGCNQISVQDSLFTDT